MKNDTPLKPYHKFEIAELYGVTTATFKRWMDRYEKDLKKLGYKKSQKILTVAQVQCLFQNLGQP